MSEVKFLAWPRQAAGVQSIPAARRVMDSGAGDDPKRTFLCGPISAWIVLLIAGHTGLLAFAYRCRIANSLIFSYPIFMKTNPRTSVSPDWVKEMSPLRWYRISGDDPHLGLSATPRGTRYLKDNDPACDPALNAAKNSKERIRRLVGREWIAPWRGRVGFSSITEAWNSSVYASAFGRSGSMIIFGGGHNDYFGSDVHAFDLARREWRRLTTGFVSGQPEEYGQGAVYPDAVYPDGSPLPPHTYDYMQYDEMGNNLVLVKGQTELGPNVQAAPIPHLFDLNDLQWRHGPRHASAVLNSGGFTTWDARRRLIWGHSGDDGGGNAFFAYSPDGLNSDGSVGNWREFHPSKLPGEANHNAMQIHPIADVILFSLHARNLIGSIDPRYPADPISPVKSIGNRPTIHEFAALEYAPALGSLVYYSAVDGANVFAIDWDGEARWRVLCSPTSLNPIVDAASQSSYRVNQTHTFGRFRIANFGDLDVAILVRHVDSPVYAMLLSE